MKLKLSVDIDDFKYIRENNYFYIDKTKLVEDLLERWGAVNYFTRPHYFGKSVNISMLRYFFEIGTDPILFKNLYISYKKELCEKYMGKFPVIFLSLKDVKGSTYEEAKQKLIELIGKESSRFSFLADSEKLTENDKSMYHALIMQCDGKYLKDERVLISSLCKLSELLYKHYEKETILLVDDYDEPVNQSIKNGYYREMETLIHVMFGMVLKGNEFLYFAVLTGCFTVPEKSIYTGLNNFKTISIMDGIFAQYFGFTDEDIKELFEAYHMEKHLKEVKEWYDGYHFGMVDVHCPWAVINYISKLCENPETKPQIYRIDAGRDSLVKNVVDHATRTTIYELECLISGETVVKSIRVDVGYNEIELRSDNFWSALLLTGYLTQNGRVERGVYRLCIPNEEIRKIYVLQIQERLEKKCVEKE